VLVAGVVGSALLVLAMLYWLGDAGTRDALGSAAATEVPEAASAATGSEQAGAGPMLDAASAPPAPEVPVTDPAASDAGPPPPTRAIAPSTARRECMAQIESARLFLQLARETQDPANYSQATEVQIARMLKARPVGPRTLTRIAERMWERREAPEREAAWWSSQYARCEAARSSGSWYVVRG
jgi:hypothetical protein